MAEWTPEANEYLDGYLKQVRALARSAGEDGEEIASGLRDHVTAKTVDEAGPLVTLEVLRRILAEIGSPEAIIETGASWKAEPTVKQTSVRHSVPPPVPVRESVDRSGKFVRWTLGCVLALVALLIAVPVLSIVAAIFLPAVTRSREAAHRAECQNHLKQIGLAIERWEEVHPGETVYPKKMSDFYPKYINNLEVFTCPSSSERDRAPDRLDIWCAYEINAAWSHGSSGPIIQEKVDTNHVPGGRNVAYNDGRVEFVRKTELAFVDPTSNLLVPVHTDNAESVARAFLVAMSTKKIDEAMQFVAEDQRSLSAEDDSFPVLPPNFELKSEADLPQGKAEVQVVGTDIGVDLVFRDGRWWVVK